MRTADEIDIDCTNAFSRNDVEALLRYAEEFETLGTRFAQGEALRCRARAARCSGSTDEAITQYRAALEVYEEVGDLGRIGVMYRDIGQVLSNKGDALAALDQFKRSLEVFEMADLPVGVAGMLGSLGNVYRDLGDVSNAMDHYQRALARAIELDRPDQIGMWTGAIASVYRSIGEYPQSVRYYLRAIEIATAAHELKNVALLHNNIGHVLSEAGDSREALIHFERSLAQYTEINYQPGIAHVSVSIGNHHRDLGDITSAMVYWQRARGIYTTFGDRPGLINASACIAGAFLDRGDTSSARDIIASVDNSVLDNADVGVQWTILLARQHDVEGDHARARELFETALESAKHYGSRQYELELYQRLRDLSQRANDFASYIHFNDAYHQLKEHIAGADASVRIAMIRKEREIENMEQERARERAVLYSALPKHIADRVIRGEQVSDHFDAVGVMFLDIVGFTTISSELSSTEVVRILDTIFETCDAICAAHHVTKIKTIGDSYMAVAFVDTELGGNGSAKNLANAALDILEAVQHLDLRIGLHYGPVTAGVLGKDRLQYDVWGDTVNVASRMENTSEPGRIHVSEGFAAALDSEKANGPMILVPRGELEIKGKGRMNTFWLAR